MKPSAVIRTTGTSVYFKQGSVRKIKKIGLGIKKERHRRLLDIRRTKIGNN